MNDSEKLDRIKEALDDFQKTQMEVNAGFSTCLQEIKRGLYGDRRNKMPGLMERQWKTERRLSLLYRTNYKMMVLIGAILLVVEILINVIKS